MRIAFVDAETRYDIGAPTADGSSGTFNDPARLGLTVACTSVDDGAARDKRHDWTVEEQADLRAYLAGCDVIVGFNSIRFDLRLIAGPTGANGISSDWLHCIDGKLVDIFMDLQAEVGRVKGTGLKAVAQETLGFTPREDVKGAFAPQLWREGQKMEVIAYCRDDTTMTRGLFYHIVGGLPLKFVDVRAQELRTVPVTWKLRRSDGKVVEPLQLENGGG